MSRRFPVLEMGFRFPSGWMIHNEAPRVFLLFLGETSVTVKLIAHTLIGKEDRKYLLIKQLENKARSLPNVLSILGIFQVGRWQREWYLTEKLLYEEGYGGELISFRINKIIHEDSQFDANKDTVASRWIYAGEILEEA